MLFIANILAVAVIGVLVLSRGPDRSVANMRSARWLRITALFALGLPVAILLLFGIGEMAGGEVGGGMHLLELIIIAALGILAWMRPVAGGIALLICGALSAAGFTAFILSQPPPEGSAVSLSVVIVAVPQMISGALFLMAGLSGRRATTTHAGIYK